MSVAAPRPGDLVAALSVALVLVPQAVAYAVLAGMPPQAGLVVGAVATIAAAPFVSSVWLQTGPVAITSMLTAGALVAMAQPASGEYVALAALLALLVGVIRLAIGLLHAGALAYLMSQPVLAGFIPGAAVVIAASQLPAALGTEAPQAGAAIVRDAADALADPARWEPAAVGLTVATIAVVLGARRIHPLVPGVLVAAVGGIVFARLTGFDLVVGDIPVPSLRPHLALPWGRTPELLLPAAVIALVGFAEAASIARRFAAETRTRWSADREFVSQGAANVAVGLFGGFPAGGSFSRSAVNRLAGARTRWSGAIAGLLVLASLPLAGQLESLPTAVLAGIIVAAVAGLADPREMLELRHFSRMQLGVALTTFALTIALAPAIHVAVVVGVTLAVLAHLRRELMLAVPHTVDGDTLHLHPRGVLYFGSAHVLESQLIDLLSEHADVDRIVLHLDGLGRVDVTGALQARRILGDAVTSGIDVTVSGLAPPSRKIMHRVLDGRPGIHVEDPHWPPGGDG